jgi:hypothetical protein
MFPVFVQAHFTVTAEKMIGNLLGISEDRVIIDFERVRIILRFIPGYTIDAGW